MTLRLPILISRTWTGTNLRNSCSQYYQVICEQKLVDVDDIRTKLPKQITSAICIPMCHIFNLSINSGIFPEKVKSSHTAPIFKSGDPALCDKYGAISLLTFLVKDTYLKNLLWSSLPRNWMISHTNISIVSSEGNHWTWPTAFD
jgi:hypothetical protein